MRIIFRNNDQLYIRRYSLESIMLITFHAIIVHGDYWSLEALLTCCFTLVNGQVSFANYPNSVIYLCSDQIFKYDYKSTFIESGASQTLVKFLMILIRVLLERKVNLNQKIIASLVNSIQVLSC